MRPALALPFLTLGLAAADALPLKAPIQRVRLHPDEAWVTRVGRARLEEAGTQRLVVADLPPGLRMDDIQVTARGPEGTRLGDVAVSADVRTVQETPEWKRLEAEREALRDRRDALEAQGEALAQEVAFLKGLQAAHDKELSARLAYATPNPAALVELSKGLEGRLGDLFLKERQRKRELEKLAKEEARVAAELQKRSSEQRTAPSRVSVELTLASPGAVTVELSYRNRQAHWRPAYEARLAEDRKHLALALYAAVSQQSGEDWSGVKLEVSNARPSRSLQLPRYEGAVQVEWSKPVPMPAAYGVASGAPGGAMDARAMENQMTAINAIAEQPRAMEAAATEGESQLIEEASGLAATFGLEGLKDVPSDGEPHRFKVLAKEVQPDLKLVALPRLDPTAYQVARFSAPGSFPLFPSAPVVQFAGAQRLGEAPLRLPAAGQPFELGFGPYKAVRVTFRRQDLKVEKVGAFTKERQWTLREEAEVANDGAEAVEVEVQDPVLKTVQEQVKVSLLPETTPGAQERVPGVRSWILAVPPKGQAQVQLATQVRAPLDGQVSGLQDRGIE